jgi:DNA-binding NarL/FixJ family response regulator
MQTKHQPITTALMDDDCFALQWNLAMLTKDLRTTVYLDAESPKQLLHRLHRCRLPEVLLLDVEYQPEEPQFSDLLSILNTQYSGMVVICLSQHGDVEALATAMSKGARGFLMKRDFRLGLGSAVIKALSTDFLISPSVLTVPGVKSLKRLHSIESIPAWKPHPALTPRLYQVFTLRVLYGMSAPRVAQEMQLAPTTVEKYIQIAYQRLTYEVGDEEYLPGINLEKITPEIRAFHQFNLLPVM